MDSALALTSTPTMTKGATVEKITTITNSWQALLQEWESLLKCSYCHCVAESTNQLWEVHSNEQGEGSTATLNQTCRKCCSTDIDCDSLPNIWEQEQIRLQRTQGQETTTVTTGDPGKVVRLLRALLDQVEQQGESAPEELLALLLPQSTNDIHSKSLVTSGIGASSLSPPATPPNNPHDMATIDERKSTFLSITPPRSNRKSSVTTTPRQNQIDITPKSCLQEEADEADPAPWQLPGPRYYSEQDSGPSPPDCGGSLTGTATSHPSRWYQQTKTGQWQAFEGNKRDFVKHQRQQEQKQEDERQSTNGIPAASKDEFTFESSPEESPPPSDNLTPSQNTIVQESLRQSQHEDVDPNQSTGNQNDKTAEQIDTSAAANVATANQELIDHSNLDHIPRFRRRRHKRSGDTSSSTIEHSPTQMTGTSVNLLEPSLPSSALPPSAASQTNHESVDERSILEDTEPTILYDTAERYPKAIPKKHAMSDTVAETLGCRSEAKARNIRPHGGQDDVVDQGAINQQVESIDGRYGPTQEMVDPASQKKPLEFENESYLPETADFEKILPRKWKGQPKATKPTNSNFSQRQLSIASSPEVTWESTLPDTADFGRIFPATRQAPASRGEWEAKSSNASPAETRRSDTLSSDPSHVAGTDTNHPESSKWEEALASKRNTEETETGQSSSLQRMGPSQSVRESPNLLVDTAQEWKLSSNRSETITGDTLLAERGASSQTSAEQQTETATMEDGDQQDLSPLTESFRSYLPSDSAPKAKIHHPRRDHSSPEKVSTTEKIESTDIVRVTATPATRHTSVSIYGKHPTSVLITPALQKLQQDKEKQPVLATELSPIPLDERKTSESSPAPDAKSTTLTHPALAATLIADTLTRSPLSSRNLQYVERPSESPPPAVERAQVGDQVLEFDDHLVKRIAGSAEVKEQMELARVLTGYQIMVIAPDFLSNILARMQLDFDYSLLMLEDDSKVADLSGSLVKYRSPTVQEVLTLCNAAGASIIESKQKFKGGEEALVLIPESMDFELLGRFIVPELQKQKKLPADCSLKSGNPSQVQQGFAGVQFFHYSWLLETIASKTPVSPSRQCLGFLTTAA